MKGEFNMNTEQRAHDIGIAFATVKMQARINSSNDDSTITLERQYLEFQTDYSFAFSAAIANHSFANDLDKE